MCYPYPTFAAFPDPGEDEGMYLAEDTGTVYRYTNDEYVPLRGTDAATQPIFLTQAEYDALEDPADSDKYPSLAGKRLVITDGNDVEYNYFAVPDYENIETISRITTIDGDWTANRTGYVKIAAVITSSAVAHRVYALLGTSAENRVEIAGSGNNTGGTESLRLSGVYKIEKDQTIWVLRSSGTSFVGVNCYFIPPKFVRKAPPVVVEEPNGSYKYEEVDTGKTWVDGTPIYRKCYGGTFTPTGAATGPSSFVIDTFTNPINFIAIGGYVTMGSTMNKRAIPFIGGDLTGSARTFYSLTFTSATNELLFLHKDPNTETYSCNFTIWIEYAKDTH
jgi:hypothetical protein